MFVIIVSLISGIIKVLFEVVFIDVIFGNVIVLFVNVCAEVKSTVLTGIIFNILFICPCVFEANEFNESLFEIDELTIFNVPTFEDVDMLFICVCISLLTIDICDNIIGVIVLLLLIILLLINIPLFTFIALFLLI